MTAITQWLTLLCGLLIFGALIFVIIGFPRSGANITRFEQASRCDESANQIHKLNTSGIQAMLDQPVLIQPDCWRNTVLPETNAARDFKVNLARPELRRILYRVNYFAPNDWDNPQSLKIYIPRIHAHAWQIWVDDRQVADNRTGWRETWNTPVNVSFYPKPNTNHTLQIGIIVTDAEGYSLSRISIGDASDIHSQAILREYLQIILPQATSVVMLMLGVFFLSFWLTRRQERIYLVMVWTSIAFFIENLRFSLRRPNDPSLDAWYVFAIHDSVIPWMIWIIYLFTELIADLTVHWYKRLLWFYAFTLTLISLPLVPKQTDFTLLKIIFYTIVTIITVIFIAWLAFKTNKIDFKVSSITICLGGYSPCHDLMLAFDWISPEFIYLAPYGTLIVFIGFLYTVQARYMAAIISQEQLNIDLAQRLIEREQLTQKLTASETELRNQQQRLLELERAQTLAEERQRLMHDMHDGLGSSLLSTLAALESQGMTQQSIAAAIRACIDDLRMVIDSLDPVSNDLIALLTRVRYRLGDRLSAAGLEIIWEIDKTPRLAWLEPSDALNILRLVQEALVNALKHAKASQIKVSVYNVPNDKIAITITDNGCGFSVNQMSLVGYGLKNQHKRAERLGGELELISQLSQGTSLSLILPINKIRKGL